MGTKYDVVVIGAGSMIGAGVFTVWAPAATAAGSALLLGLALAGLVAFANATSSADLAAVHPESGGTYVYARHRLGPAWGHLAGWGFVVGKTASCAAMAIAVGAYVWPEQERVVAIAAVAASAVSALVFGTVPKCIVAEASTTSQASRSWSAIWSMCRVRSQRMLMA